MGMFFVVEGFSGRCPGPYQGRCPWIPPGGRVPPGPLHRWFVVVFLLLFSAPVLAEGYVVQAVLEPAVFSSLSSPLSAPILTIGVREGESFKKGDALVIFECAPFKAQLEKDQADLAMARKRHEVNQRMGELDSVSQLDLALSQAQVQKSQADVGMARIQVQRCEIHAPYHGRVVKRYVQPFDSAKIGEKMLDILGEGPLRISLYVPRQWSGWLKRGQTFHVAVEDGGENYPARVSAIGAQVDPASQTLGVWGEMEGVFPRLLAGMSVNAHFVAPGDVK